MEEREAVDPYALDTTRVRKTHLLLTEDATKHELERETVQSVCGNYSFHWQYWECPSPISYLTVKEFLFGVHPAFELFVQVLCPRCKNHPDLPLSALKELF